MECLHKRKKEPYAKLVFLLHQKLYDIYALQIAPQLYALKCSYLLNVRKLTVHL